MCQNELLGESFVENPTTRRLCRSMDQGVNPVDDERRDEGKRLGRAVVFVHQHDHKITDPLVRAEVEILLLTGKAMDFAARLKGHQSLVVLTHELVVSYAKHAGLGGLELTNTVLPALKNAGLIDYRIDAANRISNLEEYVGVSATVTEQTVALLDSLGPQRSDLAFLPSVEIGAIAPLAASQHLDQIVKRGFTEQEAEDALRLARAVGLNLDAPSDELNELVVFSPYVWGTKQLSLATFLGNLPPNEREALLGSSRPRPSSQLPVPHRPTSSPPSWRSRTTPARRPRHFTSESSSSRTSSSGATPRPWGVAASTTRQCW